jgi:hypothetical protein
VVGRVAFRTCFVALGGSLRYEFPERARIAIVTPEQAILLAGTADDALRIDAGTFAAVLVGIFVLGVDESEAGLNSIGFIAPNAAVENFQAPCGGIKFPAVPCY